MRKTHIIIICTAAVVLAACSRENIEQGQRYTVGEANNTIRLSAGIVEGSAAVTKAGAEDNHGKHTNLTGSTALALRVSGTWTGKGTIVQNTTASVGSATGDDNKHNALTCSPVLYWDDYGTADPANYNVADFTDPDYGRGIGLTIYGAAINGETSVPTSLNSISGVTTESAWTGLSWTLAADQSDDINAGDLLISNNVKAGTGDGTYKFDSRGSGKLLEFRHAMSKITVNLKANLGFAGSVFANTPSVWLTSNEDGSSANTEWPFTTGTVNVTTGGISGQETHAAITMATAATPTPTWNVTKEALVVPGSEFASDNAIIAKINADGNIYYVTAKMIRTAIDADHHAEEPAAPYATEAGKNYVLNIIVNKTEIDVTATVANWTDVTADAETPVINVDANYGQLGTQLTHNFSLFISLDDETGYGAPNQAPDPNYYLASSSYTYSAGAYTPDPILYWPNHATAYYFRGIYPVIKGATSNDAPQVTLDTALDPDKQVVAVENEAYDATSFPSNFMLGMPRTAEGADEGAIMATEGTIRLNFEYAMSRVTVVVQSVTGASEVTFGTGSKVEILGGYTSGSINLSDGSSNMGASPATYEMNYDAIESNSFTCSDIILPQSLRDGTLKFKISAVNGTQTDTYETVLGISSIPVSIGGDPVSITAWEPGRHYTYTLTITKTDIVVTATLTDWVTTSASTEVWF